MLKTFLLLFSSSFLYADTVIYNAHIYTVDEMLPHARASGHGDGSTVDISKRKKHL